MVRHPTLTCYGDDLFSGKSCVCSCRVRKLVGPITVIVPRAELVFGPMDWGIPMAPPKKKKIMSLHHMQLVLYEHCSSIFQLDTVWRKPVETLVRWVDQMEQTKLNKQGYMKINRILFSFIKKKKKKPWSKWTFWKLGLTEQNDVLRIFDS